MSGDRFTRRSLMLASGGVVGMGAVAVRMAHLQTSDFLSGEWTEQARENRYDRRVVTPPRGIIYDRFGVHLATTRRDYRVSVIPQDVDSDPRRVTPQSRQADLTRTIGVVAGLLGHDEAWVRRRVREAMVANAYEPFVLRQGLHWDEFCAINVRLPELKGVSADDSETRSYPLGPVFAHPIGYVQKPTQREIDRVLEQGPEGERRAVYLRTPDVRLGKSGLEKTMESTLHGEAGWRLVEVNAQGRPVSEHSGGERKPKPGGGIVLTIDADLQRTAMEAFGEQAGSAIVMDTVTGDVLVMASAPGFDPNLFVNGIGQQEFRALNEDEKHPLYHKALTGSYSPGSTFKMVVGIAAKQAGLTDDWKVNCPGFFPFGGRNFHCWKRGGHGTVNMHSAIKGSCDVYFYRAALYAGPERIANVARALGFGQTYGVDVPLPGLNVTTAEKKGIVPDPAWWREIGRGKWTDGLTVNFGIGQGDLQVTPIQLAVYTARLASNGRAVMPRLVREGPGVREPQAFPMLPHLDPSHLAAVRAGMYGVSNEGGGTAISASNLGIVRMPDGRIVRATPETRNLPPVRIAGKTGTAQVRVITAAERLRGVKSNDSLAWRLRDHALFVCFGPWDDPRYACAVVVEHGGGGSAVAGPIAREIMRETLLKDPSRRPPARLAQLEADGREVPA
ncbi:MAG: penicillin-binding protein 2 [Hyphomonadaceae bacterium]|nr:penicillin-binding protein 2 [Hyphomonadaceae bacterium]